MIDERSQASIWVDNRVDLTSFKKIGVEEPLSIWDWRQNLSKDHGKINLLRLFTIDNWKNDGFNLTIQETRIIIKFCYLWRNSKMNHSVSNLRSSQRHSSKSTIRYRKKLTNWGSECVPVTLHILISLSQSPQAIRHALQNVFFAFRELFSIGSIDCNCYSVTFVLFWATLELNIWFQVDTHQSETKCHSLRWLNPRPRFIV